MKSFSPNRSKFAVEWDWNIKFSQDVQNVGFFWVKIDGGFRKKTWNLSKSVNVAKFFQIAFQMVLFLTNVFSTLFVRISLARNQKTFQVRKIRKNDEETEFFEKNLFRPCK